MTKTKLRICLLAAISIVAQGCGHSPNPKAGAGAGAVVIFGLGGAANAGGATSRTTNTNGGAMQTASVLGGSTGMGGISNAASATTAATSAIGGATHVVSNGRGGDAGGVQLPAHGGAGGIAGVHNLGGAPAGGAASGGSGGATRSSFAGAPCSDSLSYNELVLCDGPIGFWAMEQTSGSEPDLTPTANAGNYRGGTLESTPLPNADLAVVFNGSSQYMTIASKQSYSIPTTGEFVWEAWIRPSVLQFPNDDGAGYVDWMGKCADYSPTCEWEARMYSTTNSENRCNRLSAYVFNPSAGLGSAADWQPKCGSIEASQWYHVVGAYTLRTQPSSCANSAKYPGSIEIWVNGVQWNQARHQPTGCMSQYNVLPKAAGSPINIGTMAGDGWFPGSVAKVAFYDHWLSPSQIARHYTAMTGKQPSGSCANDCTF